MSIRTIKISLLLYALTIAYNGFGNGEPENRIQSGESLFNTYCSPCHGIHQEMIGPMLASVTKRRSEEWLMAFIKDSQQIIASGEDEYAGFLFVQYNQAVMPSFKKILSERQINDILIFIDVESDIPSYNNVVSFPDLELNYDKTDVQNGMALFESQCSSCHYIGQEFYGPALGSVTKRRPLPWLLKFIRNSQEVISSGDKYAVHLANEFEGKEMISFEYLNDKDIISILNYIEFTSASPPPIAGVNGKKIVNKFDKPTQVKPREEFDTTPLRVVIIIIIVASAAVFGYLVLKLFLYLFRSSK
jgi:mono/diheme cytochrome c family protein